MVNRERYMCVLHRIYCNACGTEGELDEEDVLVDRIYCRYRERYADTRQRYTRRGVLREAHTERYTHIRIQRDRYTKRGTLREVYK